MTPRPLAWACLLALLYRGPADAVAANAFQVDYVITVRADDPGHVQVRWRLAGIDELETLRLVFRDERTTDIHGSGRMRWQGRTLYWTPEGPYAQLSYRVAVDRRRPSGGPRFDSHATSDWLAARAWHLFPEINVTFQPGITATEPTTRLIFELPRGWRSAATGERLARDVFRIDEPGRLFHRPRGWLLLGRIRTTTRTVAGMQVTVAQAPGSGLDAAGLIRLYGLTVPALARILGPPPPRLLVVSAPDPMWRGGLSAEQSLFVHGGLPLQSHDRTSTYLHELFHVWTPFDVGDDAHWISEGLAEYYTLRLQQRAGRLSERDAERAVAHFRRSGQWPIDLCHTHLATALNNNAPFIMATLDALLRREPHRTRHLDDAVRTLVAHRGPLTTARWRSALEQVSGRSFDEFFRQHVHGGLPPGTRGPR